MSNRSCITNPSFENDEKQCDEKNKEKEVNVKKSQKNEETGKTSIKQTNWLFNYFNTLRRSVL